MANHAVEPTAMVSVTGLNVPSFGIANRIACSICKKGPAMTTRVWQDGCWTIIYTKAGGSETTASLTRKQALAHVHAVLAALHEDDARWEPIFREAERRALVMVAEHDARNPEPKGRKATRCSQGK